jgi:peroxiredoxin (alkyl hydroperoxide reductase subunit C)
MKIRSIIKIGILFAFAIFYLAKAEEIHTLVGKTAPQFTAEAVIDDEIKKVSLSDYEGKNKILVFYPADFSFICPTELFAFQEKIEEFNKRNAVILGISIDQVYTHQKWLETPRNQGGVQGITYPLISDVKKEIARAFGTLNEEHGNAFRGIFVIDKNDIVQAVIIYNESIGRDITEVLRVLDAVIFTQEHGQVCPANWAKGQEGITATQNGLKAYLNHNEENHKEEVHDSE